MTKWIAELVDLAAKNAPCVLVTVASVRGSVPREVGAKMIVTGKETIGTIGGGRLEYQCTKIACDQLKQVDTDTTNLLRRFVLGANCGQCCGGVVEILFEQMPASGAGWLAPLAAASEQRTAMVIATSMKQAGSKFVISKNRCTTIGEKSNCPATVRSVANMMLADSSEARGADGFLLEPVRPSIFNIAIFGAGHVGAATVDVLSRLDCNIRWVDSRGSMFPDSLPGNVQVIETATPDYEVLAMPPGSLFIVMTHSHPIDLEICMRVLQRDDFAYCGLIGSKSKRRRFERQMKKQGLSERQLQELVCPIGVAGVGGRKPVEIAIAVAAEALQIRDSALNELSATDANVDNVRAL